MRSTMLILAKSVQRSHVTAAGSSVDYKSNHRQDDNYYVLCFMSVNSLFVAATT